MRDPWIRINSNFKCRNSVCNFKLDLKSRIMEKTSKTKHQNKVGSKSIRAQKEIIRRLRIQNKKLQEQVAKLKEKIKKLK